MILKIRLLKSRITKQTEDAITLEVEADRPAIVMTTHFRENLPVVDQRTIFLKEYGKIKE